MLIAEIRRQLPDLQDVDPHAPVAIRQIRRLLSDSKEDVLTADVFGVLKYLPRYCDSSFRDSTHRMLTFDLSVEKDSCCQRPGKGRSPQIGF